MNSFSEIKNACLDCSAIAALLKKFVNFVAILKIFNCSMM